MIKPAKHSLDSELSFKTSRSGGAGGQNVNKVSTKVEINFDISASHILNDEQKSILLEKLGPQLTKEGILQIVSQTERTQLGNKTKAIDKFYKLLEKAFFVPKKRKPTKTIQIFEGKKVDQQEKTFRHQKDAK